MALADLYLVVGGDRRMAAAFVAGDVTISVEARAMLVRLSVAWTDPGGVVHGAGELVDVDAVTLAELEEQEMVENVDSGTGAQWVGPGSTEPEATKKKGDPKGNETEWVGPGSTEPEAKGDSNTTAWVGPGSTDV